MAYRKIGLKILLLMILFVSIISADTIENLSVAVDVAGKQRMFTQRMLKDYAMIGLKNNFGNPKKDLKKIINAFEDHLNLLIEFNKEKKTEESLLKVKSLWKPIKEALYQQPSEERAAKMQKDLEALLKQAKRSYMFFEVMNKSKRNFIPALIYKKSDDILKAMNIATGLYAAQEAKNKK